MTVGPCEGCDTPPTTGRVYRMGGEMKPDVGGSHADHPDPADSARGAPVGLLNRERPPPRPRVASDRSRSHPTSRELARRCSPLRPTSRAHLGENRLDVTCPRCRQAARSEPRRSREAAHITAGSAAVLTSGPVAHCSPGARATTNFRMVSMSWSRASESQIRWSLLSSSTIVACGNRSAM
jgi:hypothetical protein